MCEYKSKIAVIIPALDPDEKMISLVRELHGAGFENIIMVDDGSKIEPSLFQIMQRCLSLSSDPPCSKFRKRYGLKIRF